MSRAAAVLLFLACSAPAVEPASPTSLLSQEALYSDFARHTWAADLIRFAPHHVLWSDGAAKQRFLRLPPGTTIDTSDPNHWQFPIGTQLWKEFRSNGVLVETRLIQRTGPGAMDYWMGSYVWRDDESDADFAENGASNIRGTEHDAPAAMRCWACHGGEPGRILGLGTVQLAAETRTALSNRMSNPVPDYVVPDAALGYLHANCGHCHNENGGAWPDTNMILRLAVAQATAAETDICRTTLGVPPTHFSDPAVSARLAPGDPDKSCITYRMGLRGDRRQMPPLATEHVDPAGMNLLDEFIRGGGCSR